MVNKHTFGAVQIHRVCKSFLSPDDDPIPVLDHINLDIKSGEFITLIGPSGCGKSTLLYAIAGLSQADEGEILIDEESVTGTSHECGLVFQNPQLFKWMNVERNISFGLRAQKIYKDRKDDVPKYIKMIGLNGFEKSYPHQLSGGMSQRVSLARALINHPKVLLLDEPFGALDAFTRNSMQEQIQKIWAQQKMTMIMVTHDIDEAIYLSNRIIVMTPRPTTVKTIFENPCQGKREEDPQFQKLRRQILDVLEF